MAFKLTKLQTVQIDALRAKVEVAKEEVQNAAENFNEALLELREAVTEIAEDWQSEFDDKSEKWQESDRGEEVQSFISSWTEYADGLDADVEIEFPEWEEQPEMSA